MKKQYDIAAYIWPAYTGREPRNHIFWPEKMGEWETVRKAEAKFEGHTWPRRPLWGYGDEASPDVMEMQINAAADHGVNVFIYDWYWYDRRPFQEQCLNDGFLGARNNSRMKFYLMWANHNAQDIWDIRSTGNPTMIWDGKVDRAEFERVANRLIEYFFLPNYYTIDGKPVFMIYDVANLIQGLGGIDETREALEWFRERTIAAGLPGLHLQSVVVGEHSLNLSGVDTSGGFPQRDTLAALSFDSGSHYQYVHFADIKRDYAQIMPDVVREWERVTANYKMPYFPHISVGWDNNPRFRATLDSVMTGTTPEEIRKAFALAKQYADAHPEQAPLITVNSWNEWTETSYLQPDNINGYGYLQAIRDVFLSDNK